MRNCVTLILKFKTQKYNGKYNLNTQSGF